MSKQRERSIEYYRSLFRTCEVLPSWEKRVNAVLTKVVSGKDRYLDVVQGSPIPWVFPALIHSLEAGSDFTKQILNGQPYDRKTTIWPTGKGPWNTWEESAKFALASYVGYKDWSIPNMLKRLEMHNGWGYYNKGVNTPYLWSGCMHGQGVGKFITDGTYSPVSVSKQVGAGVILHEVIRTGAWSASGIKVTLPIVFDKLGENISTLVESYQRGLNEVLIGRGFEVTEVAVDGWAGKKTSFATRLVTGSYLLGDPRGR